MGTLPDPCGWQGSTARMGTYMGSTSKPVLVFTLLYSLSLFLTLGFVRALTPAIN